MKKIDVKVEKDHLERITSARPLVAISELIWNSYDADASEVRVILEGGPLTKLSKKFVWWTTEAELHLKRLKRFFSP